MSEFIAELPVDRTIGAVILALLFVLFTFVFFTLIGIAIFLAVGWLLARLAPLTSLQAIAMASATGFVVAYVSQRRFSSALYIIGSVVILTPLVTFSAAAIAWGVERFSALT